MQVAVVSAVLSGTLRERLCSPLYALREGMPSARLALSGTLSILSASENPRD